MLTRVITSDGARHVFVYNGWGIAEDFYLYGEADNQRAYLDYGFPAPGPLADCPRFGQRDNAIFGWAGQVYNSATQIGRVSTYLNLQGENGYAQVRGPDGLVQKELFDTSGGTRGLATGMETWVGMPTNAWSGGLKKKWTATTWLSDSATMPRYPRVTETNIYDDDNGDGSPENRRRATISYTKFKKLQSTQNTMPYTVYLPTETKEYAADATTVYRSAQTDYLDYIDYSTRWIVGLPSSQRLYDGGGVLQAQTELNYDWTAPVPHTTTIAQHNSANYSTNFWLRGNLTNIVRYSVVNGGAGSTTETQTDYYLTGDVAKVRDALGRETSFFYEDNFATYDDAASETIYTPATKTYAYPTQIQDPALYSSALKYWYDTGAPTKTIDPKGAAAISVYEPVHGRLLKSKTS